MRLRTRPAPAAPGVVGTARVDRRPVAALRRIRPGDVAVLDQMDLDRATAESLVAAGVAAVVDAAPSISGRYANLGPEVLLRAGVVLVDEVGTEIFERVKDGQTVRVDAGTVYVDDEPVAAGRPLDLEVVGALMDEARQGLGTQLTGVAHNATEFLRREPELLLHGAGIPPLDVDVTGRPVVVVTRDFDWQGDLAAVRRFIREQRPVLVGVDGGADVLLEAGLSPALVVVGQDGLLGDAAGPAVSDRALTSARQVLVADPSGRLVGAERLERLGVRAQPIAAVGTTTDVALLVTHALQAEVIVSVGSHPGLDEFLDRQRSALASTFLTRLKVGSRLVDAHAVPLLYSGRTPAWRLWLLVLVALVALVAAVLTTPVGADWAETARGWVEQTWAHRPDWVARSAGDVHRWVTRVAS